MYLSTLCSAVNGRFRQECLSENWFLSLEDAEEKVASWRNHYSGTTTMEKGLTALWETKPPGSSLCWPKSEIDPQN